MNAAASMLHGSVARPAVVLVTGATGFLGGALARELLRKPNVEPLFLVRAREPAAGLQKLRRHVERFGTSGTRIGSLSEANIICGGLADIAHNTHPALARTTHVVNCAALVSFAWNREVWRTNVNDTEAFAAYAARLPRLERFLHVSTAMIAGATRDRVITEPEFPGTTRQITLYTKSKAEIERRLRPLLGESLVIARPSVIVGHSALGCAPSGSIFWLFRMIHAARRVPFPPEHRIDVVPVDYCAGSIAALLFTRRLQHDCYHVSAGAVGSCSFAEIDSAFFRAQRISPSAPLESFDIARIADLYSHFQSWFGPCEPMQAAAAIRIYTAFAGLNLAFDNARLLGEGVPQAPRFCDYLEKCFESASRQSISAQMTSDLR